MVRERFLASNIRFVKFRTNQSWYLMPVLNVSPKMRVISILFLLLSCAVVSASALRLTSVYLPVYFHADTDAEILVTKVQFATSQAAPEARLSMLSSEYVPHHDTSWKKREDVNLITLYGLQITFTAADKFKGYDMVIDSSEAKVPEGYPFTVEQVVEAAKTCALKTYGEFPDHKLNVKLK